jgi:hypothetical protein
MSARFEKVDCENDVQPLMALQNTSESWNFLTNPLIDSPTFHLPS